MKIFTPSNVLISLFLFIIFIAFGLPYLDWLSVRMNWHSRAEYYAEVTLPKNVEHVDVDTLLALNGEGFYEITLTLKPDQAEAFLGEIKHNPKWQIEESKSIIEVRCSAEDNILYRKLNKNQDTEPDTEQDTDQDIENVNSHFRSRVYFCDRSRLLNIYVHF